jgi:hypothetical protein
MIKLKSLIEISSPSSKSYKWSSTNDLPKEVGDVIHAILATILKAGEEPAEWYNYQKVKPNVWLIKNVGKYFSGLIYKTDTKQWYYQEIGNNAPINDAILKKIIDNWITIE